MNRIDQLISEFEQYIENCKPNAFSSKKISVEKDYINDFLAELRMCMPEVIERSEKIVRSKESILADAKDQAEKLLEDANVQKDTLIDEHEIVQKAIDRGNEIVAQATEYAQGIVDNATAEAETLKQSAYGYVLETMKTLKGQYDECLRFSKNLYDQHVTAMEDQFKVLSDNYDSIAQSYGETPAEEAAPAEEE